MQRFRLPQICILLLAAATTLSIVTFLLKVGTISSSINFKACNCTAPAGSTCQTENASSVQLQHSAASPAASCLHLPKNLFQIANFEFSKKASPELCSRGSGHRDLIVTVVHSAVNNVDKRDSIRSTWGSVKTYGNWAFELVFLLGTDMNGTEEMPIDRNETDVVIGDFVDTYQNLTLKHLAVYKWVGEYCSQAKYILKVDDDVFVDIFHFIRIVEDKQNAEKGNWAILGNLMSGYGPEREHSKALVSEAEYPASKYPDYVSGLTYLIRTEAACEIYSAHTAKRFLWVDDVFVTGILREPLNLTIQDLSPEYYFPGHALEQKFFDWFTTAVDKSPPTFAIILDVPDSKLGSNMWEKFGRLWTKTLRSYNFRSGRDFNNR